MPEKLHTLLSIAATDPVGGAGIQADIRVASSLGLHPLTAITAITSQNSKGINDINHIPLNMLRAQLNAILEDVTPDSIKIGLVVNPDSIKEIGDFLSKLPGYIPVVIDPVLDLKKKKLMGIFSRSYNTKEIRDAYLEFLFPRATVVTPNLVELESFKKDQPGVEDFRYLLKTNAVIVKGGHSDSAVIEDKLYLPDEVVTQSHQRTSCQNLHGTGCVFSSLMASYMALGDNLKTAFINASQKMNKIIMNSGYYTLGNSTYGPLNICDYQI